MGQLSPKEVLAGRYELASIIGQGGMGAVHLATDLRLDRQVAVKVVSAHTKTADTHARFVREAQRTAQIRHPNVVEVFDVGETDSGDLFFVMELLKGEPLSERLKRESRLSLAAFFPVAREICDGLGAAHSVGIIHRDVKPANIMLVEHGSRLDHVKVLDFGIAKAQGSGTALTEAGMFLGTLEYVAPEQILGEEALDARADVYAIGALMHRMITGKALFPDVPRAGLIHHHLEVLPERPELVCPEGNIPSALSDVIMRCLAKEPAGRYATANDLRIALDRVANGLPKEAFIGAAPAARSDMGTVASSPPTARLPTFDLDSMPTEVSEAPRSRPSARLVSEAPTSAYRVDSAMGSFDDHESHDDPQLELADVGPPISQHSRSLQQGTPSSPPSTREACVACQRLVPPMAERCPHCGTARVGSGVHSRPRPSVTQRSRETAGHPMDSLAPLGFLPRWLAGLVAVFAAFGLGALVVLEVQVKAAYGTLVAVLVLSLLGFFARRGLDVKRD